MSDRRMPARFDPLATYNAERARGVAHTPSWDRKMAALQRDFDDWQRTTTPAPTQIRLSPEFVAWNERLHAALVQAVQHIARAYGMRR